MIRRPRLRSHVQALRRGPGSLQLGLHPDAGVVLEGLTDAEIAVVESLDGCVDTTTLYAVAAVAGVSPGRLAALFATMDEHHLLVDASTDRTDLALGDDPRRRLLNLDANALAAAYGLTGDGFSHVAARSTQHVVISPEGDLPHALAELLRAGGIGQVSVGADALNILDLELRRHRVNGPQSHSRSPGPDLVVLAAMGAIHPDAGEAALRHGIPHLPLVVQGHRVQVGPLITGRDGPCLTCLDLHRRDRDAAWPALLSQLASRESLTPGAPVNLESTLTAMTIGAVAMIVHTCLDGQKVPDDVSLELSLPWPNVQSRRWFRHPLCECLVGQATMTG